MGPDHTLRRRKNRPLTITKFDTWYPYIIHLVDENNIDYKIHRNDLLSYKQITGTSTSITVSDDQEFSFDVKDLTIQRHSSAGRAHD